MAATVVQLPHRGSSPAQMNQAYPSSFGLDYTTLGPEFDAKGLVDSQRVKELEYRERFYTCTQHDAKIFDFNGRMVKPGRIMGTQPLIGSNAPSFYVPLDMRRPSAPYRLGRKIVSSFTGMLFGRGRWPQVRSDDPVTQDFAEALVEAVKMRTKFIRARNIGGSCGTVGVSWCFYEGKPRISIHHGKNIHVLKWVDQEERIPEHVIELYQFERREWDENKKQHVNKWFWHRRDWTTTADVYFLPVEASKGKPVWRVDEKKSFEHGDGYAHFAYIENLPDDEPTSIDGQPDYAECYEQMNTLDILNSVNVRGAVLNLDPTLVLKMHAENVGRAVVRKGSDNALTVGETGDAKYMELSGISIQAGSSLVDKEANKVLVTSDCVLTDPDKVAAAGTSSVALKVVYAPMIGKSDLMRDQYGEGGILRVLRGMVETARKFAPDTEAEEPEQRYPHEVVTDEEGNPVVDEAGETALEPVEYYVDLPPRVEKQDILDEDGEPTGELENVSVERHPGTGRIWLEWGPYFKPTADDHQKDATALGQATGGKPVLSQQSGVEIMASAYDRDGAEEWARVQADNADEGKRNGLMFPDIGGADLKPEEGEEPVEPGEEPVVEGEPVEVPEGAAVAEAAVQPVQLGQPGKVEITSTDIAKIVTVNEARAGQGLGPLMKDGAPDPDGSLTVAEFTKLREETVKADAKIAVEQVKEAAKEAAEPETPPVPPAPPVSPVGG